MTKHLFILTAIFTIACIACVVAYRMIGVHIDSNGVLHEAFALIPLGYLTGAAAIVTGVAALVSRRRGRRL